MIPVTMLMRVTDYMDFKENTNKRGSITLDAAIVFTVLLVIISVMVTSMNVQRTDMVMQQAIDQSCEDIALILPFTVLGAEAVNLMTTDPDIGQEALDAYNKICELSDDLEELTGYSVEGLVLNGSMGKIIRNDIAHEFIKRSDELIFKPEDINVQISYSGELQVIEVEVEYEVNTMFGSIDRSHYSVIPFYGIYDSAINNVEFVTNDPTCTDDPWGMGNLKRGGYFEEKYGANLPHTFPTINSFDNGNCESIVSIDLTKDTYSSESSIRSKVEDQLEALQAFNGADVNIKGKHYVISEDEIKEKTLTIIIPENTPEDRYEYLLNASESYNDYNFNINIIKDSVSV